MRHFKDSFDEPAKVIKRNDAPVETVYSFTFKEAVLNYFKSKFSRENFRRFIKDSFPHKEDSSKEKIRKIIMDISFVLLVLSLSYIIFYYVGYRERIKDLGDWKESIDNINEEELFPFEIEKLWENIRNQYPDVDFPEGMQLKFAALYAVNQHFVGVLSIDEKEIWTPVLLNKSSPDYYLWKDLYGEYNRYGNPYMDYRCTVKEGELSKNTIIYGHNTHDKLGFNKLTTYMTLAGYKEAPVVVLDTLYEKTQWKVFAVMLTNSTSVADKGHLFKYLVTDFSSNSEFMTMINGIYERSMIRTGVDVKADDKILTLYTCYQDIFDGGRLVVFARLLREGESAEVDLSKAYFNSNARYPQAYYDQKGLENPFDYPDVETSAGENDTAHPSEENTIAGTSENITGTVSENTTGAVTENTTAAVNENTTAAVNENTTANSEVSVSVAVSETATSAPVVETTTSGVSQPVETPTEVVQQTTPETPETTAASESATVAPAHADPAAIPAA